MMSLDPSCASELQNSRWSRSRQLGEFPPLPSENMHASGSTCPFNCFFKPEIKVKMCNMLYSECMCYKMQRRASKRSMLPRWNDSREPLTQFLLFTPLNIPGLVKGMYLAFNIWNSRCCWCESTLCVAAVTLHGMCYFCSFIWCW